MAQDEKMLVPVEPTEAQIEAFRDWYFKHTGKRIFARNAAKAVQTVLSAAPAQPAAVEGAAGERFAYVPLDRGAYPDELIDDLNGFITGGSGRCRAGLEDMGVVIAAHPSPTPTQDEGAGDEAVALRQARYVLKDLHAKDGTCGYDKLAEACERAADRVQWEPADDALRVAVEKALEPFERMWAEHGDLPPTDDRHAWGFNGADLYWGDFRRAAEALAALKAGGVK